MTQERVWIVHSLRIYDMPRTKSAGQAKRGLTAPKKRAKHGARDAVWPPRRGGTAQKVSFINNFNAVVDPGRTCYESLCAVATDA